MRNYPEHRDGVCPFLERDDPRCAARLSLTRLNQAFAYCAGGCQDCPVYHELAGERAHDGSISDPTPIQSTNGQSRSRQPSLTVSGKRLGLARMRQDIGGAGSRVEEGSRPGFQPAAQPAYLGIRTAGA